MRRKLFRIASIGLGACSHDHSASCGNGVEARTHDVTQLPLDAIALDGAFDLPLGHDETDEAVSLVLVGSSMDD